MIRKRGREVIGQVRGKLEAMPSDTHTTTERDKQKHKERENTENDRFTLTALIVMEHLAAKELELKETYNDFIYLSVLPICDHSRQHSQTGARLSAVSLCGRRGVDTNFSK